MENAASLNKLIPATYLFERETEFLGWTPLSYVDSVIAVVHKYVHSALNSLQQFIDGELGSSMENEVGMQMTCTLLESAVDKNFDKWELYCLRQVFRIPKQAEICQFEDTDWAVTADQEQELDSRIEKALSELIKLRETNAQIAEAGLYMQKRRELLEKVTKAMNFLPVVESVSLPNECQIFASELKKLITVAEETKTFDLRIEAIAALYQRVKLSRKTQDSTKAEWDVSSAIKEEQLFERLMKQIPLKDFENSPVVAKEMCKVKAATAFVEAEGRRITPFKANDPYFSLRTSGLNRWKVLYLDVDDEPYAPVRISTQLTHSAPQFKISEDGYSAYNDKGYRMCKATHGVTEGCWFFEVTIMPFKPDVTNSNFRIGWSQISGDLQAPCGFDAFSYSYRALPNTLFHQSRGTEYGAAYGPGDVLGVMINLPPMSQAKLAEHSALPAPWNPSSPYVQVPYLGDRPVLEDSEIRYFLNGKDLGPAFRDLYYGKYYPAISTFNGGAVRVNFGQDPFRFMPQQACRPFSDASKPQAQFQ